MCYMYNVNSRASRFTFACPHCTCLKEESYFQKGGLRNVAMQDCQQRHTKVDSKLEMEG